MKKTLRTTIHGAVAGVIGASCMTVLRMLAHRAGLIQQMQPQAVEVWVRRKTGIRLPGGAAVHHATDQLLHLGYGLAWGGLYGRIWGVQGRPTLARTLGFALGQWAFGSVALLPKLGVARSESRASPKEVTVNLAAHILYSGVTAFVTQEFEEQLKDQPFSYPRSRFARSG